MTIIEALVQLRDDLKLWVANNLRVKQDNIWAQVFKDLIEYQQGNYVYNGKTLIIPYGTTNIDEWRIDDYRSTMTEVVIPNTVTTMDASAFMDCDSLKEVTIPYSITELPTAAFQNCDDIESVVMQYYDTQGVNGIVGVKTVGAAAFKQCTALKTIDIPDILTTINESAFADCTSLETVNIVETGAAIESATIGNGAFSNCTALKDVTLPFGTTTIGENAFSNCTNIENIYIPSSLTSIGYRAFIVDDSVTDPTRNVYFDGDIYSWNGINMASFNSNPMFGTTATRSNNLYMSNGGSTFSLVEDYTFPESSDFNDISDYIFYGCTSLTSLTIPIINNIGSCAFSYCRNLTTVKINTVSSIGTSAFVGCTSVTSYDFSECTSVPTLASSTMFDGADGYQIKVPSALYGTWVAAENWSTYASHIVAV